MLTFQRVFATRQQALDVYRSQLSGQKLYVESFEGYSKGSEVEVKLEIRETSQKIVLKGTVERVIGKKEVVELGYGQRPGLMLNIPITGDIVQPLRGFFLAQNTQNAQNTKSSSSPVRPSVMRPGSVSAKPAASDVIPFANIDKCSPEEALSQVDAFLELSEKCSLFSVFNVRSSVDRKELRRIYNIVVRKLHPDSYPESFDAVLTDKLSDAYQVFNEAYKILQHPVLSAIYMDISKQERRFEGMSLPAYKKWLEDYRTRNAANIRLAEDFANKALASEDAVECEKNLRLALQYDPFNETAREAMK